ncbi:MAG: hypothetical protein WCX73_00010 [Candidatus Pacearchaeota archaeon]
MKKGDKKILGFVVAGLFIIFLMGLCSAYTRSKSTDAVSGEGLSVTVSCDSGDVITGSSTSYGSNCGGSCPISCGTCSTGVRSCTKTFSNDICGSDCSYNCAKIGTLTITCSDAACTPQTDAELCSGKCGYYPIVDRCNNFRNLNCGGCPSGQVCKQSSNTCCTPQSDSVFCSSKGITCGHASGMDNCGQSRDVSCSGSCASGETCNPSSGCFCDSSSGMKSCIGGSCISGSIGCNSIGEPASEGKECVINEDCVDDGNNLFCCGGYCRKPNYCEDGDLCTVNSCDAETGCYKEDVVCSVSNPDDACIEESVCNPLTGLCNDITKNCDKGDLCFVYSCNKTSGCVSAPKVTGGDLGCVPAGTPIPEGQEAVPGLSNDDYTVTQPSNSSNGNIAKDECDHLLARTITTTNCLACFSSGCKIISSSSASPWTKVTCDFKKNYNNRGWRLKMGLDQLGLSPLVYFGMDELETIKKTIIEGVTYIKGSGSTSGRGSGGGRGGNQPPTTSVPTHSEEEVTESIKQYFMMVGLKDEEQIDKYTKMTLEGGIDPLALFDNRLKFILGAEFSDKSGWNFGVSGEYIGASKERECEQRITIQVKKEF